MAMTKKERTEVAALKYELTRLRAFRLTGPVEPDLPPPLSMGAALTLGWDFNQYAKRVFKACSSHLHHGEGWERTSTQGGKHLFSTPQKAHAALRYAVEQMLLDTLVRLDFEAANSGATPT